MSEIEDKIARITLGRGSIQEGADVTRYINDLRAERDEAKRLQETERQRADAYSFRLKQLDAAVRERDEAHAILKDASAQLVEARAQLKAKEDLLRRSVRKSDGMKWCICMDPENCKTSENTPNMPFACRATSIPKVS